MSRAIGTRVGAIQDADQDEVRLYGYGVYEGDQIPPFDLEVLGMKLPPRPNPKIKLDDGGVVWGFQCWWGPEEEVKRSIAGRRVVIVAPPVMEEDAPPT